MKPSNGSCRFKAVLLLTLAAAAFIGDGIAEGANLTQAQFNADLLASQPFKALRAKVATDAARISADTTKINAYKARISADEAKIAADEAVISRMATFGHSAAAPDALTVAIARATANINAHGAAGTDAFGAAIVADTGFGPCPDMGTHIGDASPNPVSTSVAYFKQCDINGDQYMYGAIPGVGSIATTPKVWFTGTDCTGDAVEIDDGENYNGMALTRGVVFRSPADNSLEMVQARQSGVLLTVHSAYSGVCVNEDTTATAYSVTLNDINVTGVPDSVPADFIY